jgi:hypothetical protein
MTTKLPRIQIFGEPSENFAQSKAIYSTFTSETSSTNSSTSSILPTLSELNMSYDQMYFEQDAWTDTYPQAIRNNNEQFFGDTPSHLHQQVGTSRNNVLRQSSSAQQPPSYQPATTTQPIPSAPSFVYNTPSPFGFPSFTTRHRQPQSPTPGMTRATHSSVPLSSARRHRKIPKGKTPDDGNDSSDGNKSDNNSQDGNDNSNNNNGNLPIPNYLQSIPDEFMPTDEQGRQVLFHVDRFLQQMNNHPQRKHIW